MPAPVVALRGPGVLLRPWVPRDEDELLDAVRESVAELAPYETWCTEKFGARDAEHYITDWMEAWSDGSAYYFAVRDGDTGRLLGSAGLSGVNRTHRVAGLGYWVRTFETGRGIASAAASAVSKWGVTALSLNRIEVLAAITNPASRRVAEKIGGDLEGVLRRRLILPDGPTDMAMYSLIS